MPLEFAPPIEQGIQPFNVPAPQYTDPLQTLAEMGQLKQQSMQNQQLQMDLQSQQGFMRAYQDANGDIDQTIKIAPQYGVLPKDIYAAQKMALDAAQQRATLDKTKMEEHNLWRGEMSDLYQPLFDADPKDQPTLAATIGQKAVSQGLVTPDKVFQYTDPQSVKLYQAGLNSDGWLAKKSEAMRSQAEAQKAKAEMPGIVAKQAVADIQAAPTDETGVPTPTAWAALQAKYPNAGLPDTPTPDWISRFARSTVPPEKQPEYDLNQRQRAIADIQAAPTDETGVPTPAAWAALQRKYPNVGLPGTPTPNWISQFVRSSVSPEKQPEFDLNSMKVRMGLMGNSEYDQFLLQYARSLGKTPAQLSPTEGLKSFQAFAMYKQDPDMLRLAMGQKQLQEQMLRTQLASLPTPEMIDTFANMAVNHEMSPDQFGELRSGRTSAAPQIIMRAKQVDPNFNMARLEAEYKAMSKAEADFGTGAKGDLFRSNNNTLEHMGQLDQARQALGSGDLPLLRGIGQALGVATGGDAATTYDLIAKKVGEEFTKSFIPGAGGERERIEAAGDFRRTLGDNQIKSNIKAAVHAMDVQQQNLIHQYNTSTYGKGTLGQNLMTPEAQAARDRVLGTKPAGGGPVKDDTRTYQGHTYKFDGKQWVRQ